MVSLGRLSFVCRFADSILYVLYLCFFFQAEDGIRDAQESRGLGDVYKRQVRGRHVICSVVDYPDLLTNAAFLEKIGFEVSYLEPDAQGRVSPQQLKDAIRDDTVLFMTTIVNHVVGTIQPMREYRDILRAAGHKIHFHADACQAYGLSLIHI